MLMITKHVGGRTKMIFNQESILNIATSEENAGDFPKVVHGF